jgi:hypothetical protein
MIACTSFDQYLIQGAMDVADFGPAQLWSQPMPPAE